MPFISFVRLMAHRRAARRANAIIRRRRREMRQRILAVHREKLALRRERDDALADLGALQRQHNPVLDQLAQVTNALHNEYVDRLLAEYQHNRALENEYVGRLREEYQHNRALETRDYLQQRLTAVRQERDTVERLRNEAVDLAARVGDMLENEHAGRLRAEHLLEVELDRRTIGWYAQ